MQLRRSFDGTRGLFVSIDGPGGAGKTTTVRHVAEQLVEAGQQVHVTTEPSRGPIGLLARELTETVTGLALACLYAADRYHHLEKEVQPKLAAGISVISDRYVASGMAVQRLDGVDPTFLWQINAHVIRPDVAVILESDPAVAAQRITQRGAHNRFQRHADYSRQEAEFYGHAADQLLQAGFNVVRVDCTKPAPFVATEIVSHLIV